MSEDQKEPNGEGGFNLVTGVIPDGQITPDAVDFRVTIAKAQALVQSGLLPNAVNTWQKAVVIMMAGSELGLPPMTALRGLYVVDGLVSLSTQLMLALAWRSGKLERYDHKYEGEKGKPERTCIVVTQRVGQEAKVSQFSLQDAENAELAKKSSWTHYPDVMLLWRATAIGLRATVPDVLAGLYTPEELDLPIAVKGDDVGLDWDAISERAREERLVQEPDAQGKPSEATQDKLRVIASEIKSPTDFWIRLKAATGIDRTSDSYVEIRDLVADALAGDEPKTWPQIWMIVMEYMGLIDEEGAPSTEGAPPAEESAKDNELAFDVLAADAMRSGKITAEDRLAIVQKATIPGDETDAIDVIDWKTALSELGAAIALASMSGGPPRQVDESSA